MITRISIRNFKAIRDASADLTPIHLLIGPNDSGKTSVLEAIAAICRSVDHDAANSFLGRHPETQIVMTSHSPYLVDAFQPEEVTWCCRNETGDVILTRLDRLPEVERSLSVFSLGEIWTGELEPLPASEDSQ